MIRNYDECLKEITDICELGYDWNDNGAPAISTSSACNALLLLDHLPEFGEWSAFPVAYNPAIIQLEFENDKIYIEIECHPLEYVLFVKYADGETFNMTFPTVKQTIKYLNKIYG